MAPRLALVLDVDDTLYLEHDYQLSGFASVGGWLQTVHGIAGFEPVARTLYLDGHRGRIFNQALARLGVDEAGLIPAMIEQFRAHEPVIGLLPDARAALERWHGRHHLAAITDGYAQAQNNKVAALGLAAWIDPVIVTDMLGREFWKPHEKAFRCVEAATGLPSGHHVYIGDNPTKDFLAPQALGWRTVRIRRPEGLSAMLEINQPADLEIASFDALSDPVLASIL